MTKKQLKQLSPDREEKRLQAEASLEYFITLVHPLRVLGNIHREVINWITRSDANSHQLVLLPRDHGKSWVAAYWAAWMLTKDPTLRILYISSTSNLATKQLKFIKDILTSDTYRLYWPDMVNKEEAKREKWTEREIAVDHPKRKQEAIRDPSIWTAGLTSNIVGMHSDINILDDVVVQTNAYLEEGRDKVETQYGYLSSIGGGNVRELVIGTRYHPLDLYHSLLDRTVDQYDENGSFISAKPLFEVFERQVENIGDGTGEFIWPRQQRFDGKWFGFNQEILAQKRASYANQIHFRAQYYNNPQDIDSSPIQRDLFQYYDQNYLNQRSGKWYFRTEKLNVFAAVDFAFSLGRKSDSTAIVVVGVDADHNYYVLDIDRFKTDKPSDYFTRILKMYEKWGFNKIRAEVNVAQKVLVNDLKDNYIRKHGLSLSVEEFSPSRWVGSKEERILATLEPRYANRQIWHYQSGNCQVLEEELLFTNPAHDDVKDALASAIDFAQAPSPRFNQQLNDKPAFQFHSRWGGVA